MRIRAFGVAVFGYVVLAHALPAVAQVDQQRGGTTLRLPETVGPSRPRRDGSFAKAQGGAITKSFGNSRDASRRTGVTHCPLHPPI